jgi:hypothetical protein
MITPLFPACLSFALALSETFPRFSILTLLLLLSLAHVVVSHTLSLRPLRRGTPLIVFRPVSREAPSIPCCSRSNDRF